MAPGLIYLASEAVDKPNIDSMTGTATDRLTIHYKNADSNSKRPYLTLTTADDTEFSKTHESSWSKSADGALATTDLRPYAKIQTFEGAHGAPTTGQRLPTIVCVAMEPGASPEAENDFEDWYRRQHLDMMSMCRGYRRCTRYCRLDGVSPRYLAIHEYACTPEELPTDQIAITTRTEWAKKILGEAQTFDRNVFTLVGTSEKTNEQL